MPFPGAEMNGTMYGMGSLGSGADDGRGMMNAQAI